jgi:hypothetical protein
MLTKWLREYHRPTCNWSALAEALRSPAVGQSHLAVQIQCVCLVKGRHTILRARAVVRTHVDTMHRYAMHPDLAAHSGRGLCYVSEEVLV